MRERGDYTVRPVTPLAPTLPDRLRRMLPPQPAPGSGAWSRLWPLVVAVVIAFATWPVGSVVPQNGLDPSWRIALHMAVAQGVDFGRIAFTYGPLGFLEAPVNAEPHTLVPSFAWIALLQVAFAYLVIESARRTLRWPVAVGLAFVACQLFDEGREVLPLVAFLWAALVVQWGVPPRIGRVLLPVSGVVAGMGVLIKFNEGAIAVALAGVAALWLGPRGWRALGIFAGSVAAGVLVPWLALGNGISGLPRWMVASVRIAGGYSAGLPAETAGRGWEYPLFIVVVAVIGWFAWRSGEGLDRARRAGMALLGAIIGYSLFKHGFVRHDLGHSGSTFTGLIAVAAAVRWSGPLGRLAGLGACGLAVLSALALYTSGPGPSVRTLLDPGPRMETAARHARLALSPGRREREREAARQALRALHAIPSPVIEALRGRSVHVDPYETSVVWAYDLRWRPVPVFQDYSIFTNALDRTNADAYASARAPERVLRHGGARIDGHSPEGEGPEQFVAMICRYRQQVGATGWQVLARTPSSRCGPERPLSSVTAPAGQDVPVPSAPSPDDLVVARIHVSTPLTERLRTFLYKPRELPEVVLSNGYAFRMPAALLAGPLMVRAPATLGWADYAAGFQFDTLRVSYVASPIRVDFAAVRVAPSSPGG